ARVIDYPKIDKGRSRSAYNAEIIDLNQRRAMPQPPRPKQPNIAQRLVDTQSAERKERPAKPSLSDAAREAAVLRYWKLVDEIEEAAPPPRMDEAAKMATFEKRMADEKKRAMDEAFQKARITMIAVLEHDEQHKPKSALEAAWKAAKGLLGIDPAKTQRAALVGVVSENGKNRTLSVR
ncbi:hypothetical protein, partial [Elstera cyanobacteriorum]|uniref:hypothetical protein n=1 Tax=Elstera cyanobacteriorum TaxID=2022747 RepID=UPI0023544631